jgi:hypothetical protein
MLNLFIKLVFNLLMLVIIYFTGVYPLLSMLCDLIGIDNPTLIFSDTLTDSVDTDSLKSEEQPFYQRKSFWLGVGVITIIIVVGVFFFFSKPDSSAGGTPGSESSITGISQDTGPTLPDVPQIVEVAPPTYAEANTSPVYPAPIIPVVHYPYFESPTHVPFVGTNDAVTTPVSPLFGSDAVNYLTNNSPTVSEYNAVSEAILSTGHHPYDPDPFSDFYIG